MSKSAGGGGGGGAIIKQAVADVNKIGLGSRYVKYLREGMREEGGRKAGFAGATPTQANLIATGRMGSMNWGKKFDPVKVAVEYTRKGRPSISVIDGRHRLIGARGAGATRIRAEIHVARKIGGKWVDSKPAVRIVKI